MHRNIPHAAAGFRGIPVEKRRLVVAELEDFHERMDEPFDSLSEPGGLRLDKRGRSFHNAPIEEYQMLIHENEMMVAPEGSDMHGRRRMRCGGRHRQGV